MYISRNLEKSVSIVSVIDQMMICNRKDLIYVPVSEKRSIEFESFFEFLHSKLHLLYMDMEPISTHFNI